ncbi:DNA translocase FtsK [Fructilactobacillus sp. Tb1]|uniref:DNA translocase FtsK n=1 Tax=Fructilactobacillus sp. Tb1 TaxID=3422304 RepID=UPI003D2D6DB7
MDRYDGPAFFRKYFNGKKPFENTNSGQVNPKVLSQAKSGGDENKIKKQSNSSKQHFIKPQSAETTSNLVEQTRSFQPKKVFDAEHNFNHRTGLSTRYKHAISILEKAADDLILLTENDDSEPLSKVTTVTEPVTQSEVVKPVADSTDDEPVVNISEIEAKFPKKTNDVSSENEQKTEDEIYENKNENTVDNSKKEPIKPNITKGLGHSLTDILKDESGLADNLALFNKNEQTKPATDAPKTVTTAPEEKQASTALVVAKEKPNLPDIQNETHSAEVQTKQPEIVKAETPASNEDDHFITQASTPKFNDTNYNFPSDSLLVPPVDDVDSDMDDWITDQAITLDNTLEAFHVKGHVVDWTNGPTVTQFQVKLDLGVKVSKVTNLTDDLKMALAAKDIRIEAPIPGKSTVGIEIPNRHPRPVMLSEILESNVFKDDTSVTEVAMGVDIEGHPVTANLNKMPHALIAGATGSGKSVFINSLLVSLLYHASPSDLRMILIDPKAVELAPYNEIPHLISPVISDPKEASAALKWVTTEMDNRYDRLAAAGVRNIEQYNKKAHEANRDQDKLPYILVVIDELADLMMVASSEVQDYIVRITQKARAAGIHLIVATQRPSVDIVTGTIKNNIPTRIAFMVSSQIDSRTIIDQAGAERLLGKGDMLYQANGANKPERLQGAFVTNKEVEKVTNYVRSQGSVHYDFDPKSLLKRVDQAARHDDIWKRVLEYIAGEDNVSTSKLQRVFSIGYNRAATIIDDLEKNNFISGQHGSKARDVYLTEDDFKKLNI